MPQECSQNIQKHYPHAVASLGGIGGQEEEEDEKEDEVMRSEPGDAFLASGP